MNIAADKFANILLIEDNPGDIRLTQEAIKENKINMNLTVMMDGEEALNYLRKQGKYTKAITPDLILLDLNLPKKNGKQILKEIKGDPDLKFIPVVVLTISHAKEDIVTAYQLQANCYICKPLDLHRFIEVIKSIENFWFNIATLPNQE